ncbi:hypothetical protein RJP21_17535 [Paenibacillus sp. VCA1]|nr:hypothetical protein [Paenibacillus sp. VCA1]MDR9855420.1 hypothetical protein [Paenibacillus sp. VCA1]
MISRFESFLEQFLLTQAGDASAGRAAEEAAVVPVEGAEKY